MTRVRVTEHIIVNINRRSLCDNCVVRGCLSFHGSRVFECPDFRPYFEVFIRCRKCGEYYSPYTVLSFPDLELCPKCNNLLVGNSHYYKY
jgi:hypothetical protein